MAGELGLKSLDRAVVPGSLLCGAFAGWGASTGAMALFGAVIGAPGLMGGALLGVLTLPFWFAGLLFLGGPAWAGLYLVRRTGPKTATAAGAVLAFIATPIVMGVLFDGSVFLFDSDAFGLMLLISAPISVGGATAGFTTWWIAYDGGRLQ